MRVERQRLRSWFQAGFFLLFVLAPPLDLFRFDLNLNHFFFLGMHWTLGLDALMAGEISGLEAGLNILVRGFVPLLLIGGGLIWIAFRYGRLYCGWLCPHFSVVETINRLMFRASGKQSIWEKSPQPELQPDGATLKPEKRFWPLTWLAALGFAFLWAVVLLTYLLPPSEIYHNLLHGSLTSNQARFIGVGTLLLFIEFMFARHLFCRFGCVVGLFQSLAWMANDRGMVVGFDRNRARLCGDCNNACDNICPMRLKPRTIKRRMFTCTECAQCISACEQVQAPQRQKTLLHWVEDEAAIQVATSRPATAETDSSDNDLQEAS
ncbi:MAG: 4Fe-4S binding protein [gamma proteobacterium endosymbiont of Lamellibrachia anaximandri]|nr:4Fe-4S binding protein [gamma proteobacterium endosymbiont of Lamellibrachia anaximandri]MBL3534581.1 4Fe-4S binding protein [gamma proteobacterium endosymbiont of Lamellibrachia anaximandri]